MDVHNELAMHDTDREGWLSYVAPSMARRLENETESTLGMTWARIPRDYQAAIWKHLDETNRERIRKVRGTR